MVLRNSSMNTHTTRIIIALEVRKESFSTTNPDSGNFLDKKESKVTRIEPNLPIEKFVMTDYL